MTLVSLLMLLVSLVTTQGLRLSSQPMKATRSDLPLGPTVASSQLLPGNEGIFALQEPIKAAVAATATTDTATKALAAALGCEVQGNTCEMVNRPDPNGIEPEVDEEVRPGGSPNFNAARIALGVVAATYGSNYACVKLLDEWVGDPAVAATLRFTVASAAMLPALAYLGTRVDSKYISWPLARDGLMVGLWFWLGYAVQAVALETSAASLQAFLLSLSVVVCPLLERFLDGALKKIEQEPVGKGSSNQLACGSPLSGLGKDKSTAAARACFIAARTCLAEGVINCVILDGQGSCSQHALGSPPGYRH
jgi:hypothetical protein